MLARMELASGSSMAVTRHPTIRDQIATTLRRAIADLELKPGQLLIERELTERTGASRPSVREALRQLEAEGLVESRNGRGTYVRALTLDEARDVYEVRAQLEGLAARLFTERADAATRDRLSTAMDALRAATEQGDNSRAVLDAQAEFYAALFHGSGNDVLDRTVQGLQVRIAQLRALTLAVEGRDQASLEEFARIARAIESGDAAAAEREAALHIQNAARVMATAHDLLSRSSDS
ncbi:GntR family transcriptional regulator [Microbacterium sp. AG1240]|nr:GntR family transcriptional regulator [Microbacterium sp. AG1240]